MTWFVSHSALELNRLCPTCPGVQRITAAGVTSTLTTKPAPPAGPTNQAASDTADRRLTLLCLSLNWTQTERRGGGHGYSRTLTSDERLGGGRERPQ